MMSNLDDIVNEAFIAAAEAAAKTIAENPGTWYPCGFAWVRIKPARGKLVSFLKDKKIGRTDEYEGGYVIYNPSHNPTQWMDAKADGARAFAQVLQKHGFKCSVETRMD